MFNDDKWTWKEYIDINMTNIGQYVYATIIQLLTVSIIFQRVIIPSNTETAITIGNM